MIISPENRAVFSHELVNRRSIRSEIEARWEQYPGRVTPWREHRYKGGPPPPRLKHMQLHHETRARVAGVQWDMVDLRTVYARDSGICGICGEPVSIDVVTFDHIVPISRGGPHLFENLQPAHFGCNSAKRTRTNEEHARRRAPKQVDKPADGHSVGD